MKSQREKDLIDHYDRAIPYGTPIADPDFVRELMKFAGTKLDKVLDVGCGLGVLSKIMYDVWKSRVDGIDISQVRIYQARKFLGRAIYPPVKMIYGDIYDLDKYFEGEYDLVVMVEVLEHLEEPLEVLRQARGFGPVVGSVPIDMNIDEHLQYYETIEDALQKLQPDRSQFWDRTWSIGKGFLMLYWEKQDEFTRSEEG